MKEFLLITVGVCLTGIVAAQVIHKGDKLLGGSFGAYAHNTSQNTADNRNSNAGIYPSLSFGIRNNLAWGVRGGIGYNRIQNVQNATEYVQSSFSSGLGLFVKKYNALQNRFGFYFDNSLTGNVYTSKSANQLNPPNVSKGWGIGYQLSPGIFYQFTDRFFGEANIGGLHASYSTSDNNNTDQFSVGASFLQFFNLGINYRIGRKIAPAE